jgi:hypothetical protein
LRFFSVAREPNKIAGRAGDVLEDDPTGRVKVYVYDLPRKYNTELVEKDPRCLTHMFATEVLVHRSLLSSPVRTLDPEEADWFLRARVHHLRPDAVRPPDAVRLPADDAQRDPAHRVALAVLEPVGGRRPLLRRAARLRCLFPLQGGAGGGAGRPPLASPRHAGPDVRAEEPRLPQGRVRHRAAVRAAAEDARPGRAARHPALHLRLLPWPVLRHQQRPRGRLLREVTNTCFDQLKLCVSHYSHQCPN